MGWFKKDEIEGMSLGEITELLGWLRTPTGMVFTPTNLQEEKEKFFIVPLIISPSVCFS